MMSGKMGDPEILYVVKKNNLTGYTSDVPSEGDELIATYVRLDFMQKEIKKAMKRCTENNEGIK